MGSYQCVADNGIPPSASVTFNLEVHCECKILNIMWRKYSIKIDFSYTAYYGALSAFIRCRGNIGDAGVWGKIYGSFYINLINFWEI